MPFNDLENDTGSSFENSVKSLFDKVFNTWFKHNDDSGDKHDTNEGHDDEVSLIKARQIHEQLIHEVNDKSILSKLVKTYDNNITSSHDYSVQVEQDGEGLTRIHGFIGVEQKDVRAFEMTRAVDKNKTLMIVNTSQTEEGWKIIKRVSLRSEMVLKKYNFKHGLFSLEYYTTGINN